MKDTPPAVEALQLKIWLSKSPAERLRQMMKDNDALYRFWSNAKVTGGENTAEGKGGRGKP